MGDPRKRTVKEGECAAIWTMSGKRKLIIGPQRVRMLWSHVRFLDRYVADDTQYLLVQFRDGPKENHRGPIAIFCDPCIHEKMEVVNAFKLAANEAIVVYTEEWRSMQLSGSACEAQPQSRASASAALVADGDVSKEIGRASSPAESGALSTSP